VVDFAANAHVLTDAFPMSQPRLIAEERSRFVYGIETDILEAYNAIPLDENSAGLTCIEADELGLLEFAGLPMGAKNAGEELYRRVDEHWDRDAVKASYADNLHNFVNGLDEGLDAFEALLAQTDKAGVRLNLGDTEVCNTISQFLGYESQKGAYTPGRRLMGALLDMRQPRDVKELTSLLASANVLRRFVPDFNALIEPFSHLLSKKNPFNWTILEEAAFITLKRVMTSPAIVKPFDAALETAVYTDFNGTKNGRRAAVGCSLWQRHGDTWHPVLFGSRYLSLAETRFITKESAFSSSAGECIAFAFAVREFYSELSQCPSFQVLADARNLTWWRTSSAPLMVNLRAQISGLYDLSVIKLRHIKRAGNFADVLARLSAKEVFDEFNELAADPGYSQYVYSLTDVLRCDRQGNDDDSVPQPVSCVQQASPRLSPVDMPVAAGEELGAEPLLVPRDRVCSFMSASAISDQDGFALELFSPQERIDMAKSKQFRCRSGQPVTRKLHGRTLFAVPKSKVEAVWLENHIANDGYHYSLADTRLAVSHLHWGGKLGDLRLRFGACECQEAMGPKGLKPIQVYQGQSARPGVFGEVVYFDQKSFPTHAGRRYIGTSLDKTTGLFNAIPISGPTGDEAIRQIKTFLASGRKIGAAIFDRHAAYLKDKKFRAFLDSLDIVPYYSKGEDPKFISDLERCHQELNRLVRTLPDPWDWLDSLLDLLFVINDAPIEGFAGATRGGMALGHSPVEARAIALRHKSRVLADRDTRPVELPLFKPGDTVLLNMKFKSQVEEARRVVKVLLIDGAKSLCQYRDENPRWLANVHIMPMPNGAGVGAALPPGPVASEDIDDAALEPGADLPMAPPAPHRHLPVDLPVGAGEVPAQLPAGAPGGADLDMKYNGSDSSDSESDLAGLASSPAAARKRSVRFPVRFQLPDGEIVRPGSVMPPKLRRLLQRSERKAVDAVPERLQGDRPVTRAMALRSRAPAADPAVAPAVGPAVGPAVAPLIAPAVSEPENRVPGRVARAQKVAKSARLPRGLLSAPAADPAARRGLPVDLPLASDGKQSVPSGPSDPVPGAVDQGLQVGDWVVASEGLSPWFGVVTSVLKDEQLMVHHFKFREAKRGPAGKCHPAWINDAGRQRVQQYCPSGFDPAVYIISLDNVVMTQSRREKDFYLPVECMKALADYARSH